MMPNISPTDTKQSSSSQIDCRCLIYLKVRVWLFYCPTTMKAVITIVHHSSHQVEAFISAFLSDVHVAADNISSSAHVVPDPLLNFRLTVIYCSACASKLPLNLHSCGSDRCSHIQQCCFNAWIRELKV